MTVTFPLLPRYKTLIRLLAFGLLLLGAAPPVVLARQAFSGHLDRFAWIALVAGFPFLVLCLFCSHLLGRLAGFHQLEAGPDGLCWRSSLFRAETGWDNLAQPLPQTGLFVPLRAPVRLLGAGEHALLPQRIQTLPCGLFGPLDSGPLAERLQQGPVSSAMPDQPEL